jgi:hypothetical protein
VWVIFAGTGAPQRIKSDVYPDTLPPKESTTRASKREFSLLNTHFPHRTKTQSTRDRKNYGLVTTNLILLLNKSISWQKHQSRVSKTPISSTLE